MPGVERRPVGSYQRAVTVAEVRRGVRVSVLELRQGAESRSGAVVAWVEAGRPDLDFDGRTARPLPGAMFGLARRASAMTRLQLRHRAE